MPDLILTCSCCGYQYVLPEGVGVLACPACGMQNARPAVEGPTLDLLDRAVEQRVACDFSNAEDTYQQVIQLDPSNHEARWGLVLCKYGVEYIEDPKTKKRMPTVHFVRPKPLQSDVDYQAAWKAAPEEVRAGYARDAAYIDEVQAGIRQKAQDMPPYDVFLCHKTTKPGSSDMTQDYYRANQLYYRLKEKGARVFFAPESLKGLAGASYEAGIYHALQSAPLMLLICSDADHLNSPWVRSEWTRFLEMIGEKPEKKLVPLLYDPFSASQLPIELRYIQALSMEALDAVERLESLVNVAAKEPAKDAAQPDLSQLLQNIVGSEASRKFFSGLQKFTSTDAPQMMNSAKDNLMKKMAETREQLGQSAASFKAAQAKAAEKKAAEQSAEKPFPQKNPFQAKKPAPADAPPAKSPPLAVGNALISFPPPIADCANWPHCRNCSQHAAVCSKLSYPVLVERDADNVQDIPAEWGAERALALRGPTKYSVCSLDERKKANNSLALICAFLTLAGISLLFAMGMGLILIGLAAVCYYYGVKANRTRAGILCTFTAHPGKSYVLSWLPPDPENPGHRRLKVEERGTDEGPNPPEAQPDEPCESRMQPPETVQAVPDAMPPEPFRPSEATPPPVAQPQPEAVPPQPEAAADPVEEPVPTVPEDEVAFDFPPKTGECAMWPNCKQCHRDLQCRKIAPPLVSLSKAGSEMGEWGKTLHVNIREPAKCTILNSRRRAVAEIIAWVLVMAGFIVAFAVNYSCNDLYKVEDQLIFFFAVPAAALVLGLLTGTVMRAVNSRLKRAARRTAGGFLVLGYTAFTIFSIWASIDYEAWLEMYKQYVFYSFDIISVYCVGIAAGLLLGLLLYWLIRRKAVYARFTVVPGKVYRVSWKRRRNGKSLKKLVAQEFRT